MARKPFAMIGRLKTVDAFRAKIDALNLDLACDDNIQTAPTSSLAQSYQFDELTIGNRFAIQPMEGWDGSSDGSPTDNVFRRWRNFGLSGAKLIWGGEAVAVRHTGRANPNQLVAANHTQKGIGKLREELLQAHKDVIGSTDDLLIGLQLTHSGRFCRPNDKVKMIPQIAYHHPILDRKFNIDPNLPILTDSEIRSIIEDYQSSARMAYKLGYQFVDIKHCHGYLGHEFLSAFTRPGPFGGSFENRTRFLREIVDGIRSEVPNLRIGVRLSAFDLVPYKPNPTLSEGRKLGPGIPEDYSDNLPYNFGFGLDPDQPEHPDLTETYKFLDLLLKLNIRMLNLSAGSPYYNPHIQRPALYPPSDGYQPPEDPLFGVARQINIVQKIKKRYPNFLIVGSAYSYLQEFLPHVAQKIVRNNYVDFIGLGRMVLSYPDLPNDVLRDGIVNIRKICRTFSDCTTAPRNGLISGCFPLDPFYKKSPEGARLREIKRNIQT